MGEAVKTEGGRRSVAEAIMTVVAAVAMEISSELDSLVVSGAGPVAGGDTRYPEVCEYMSRRVGMFLAWLDAGVLTAIEDEALRIEMLKEQWLAMELFFGLLTSIPGIPDILGPAVGAVFVGLRPDFEGNFVNFQSALKVFRESFNTIAQEVLKELLFSKVPEDERLTSSHPEIARYTQIHGGSVLMGWDDELRFLGLRA